MQPANKTIPYQSNHIENAENSAYDNIHLKYNSNPRDSPGWGTFGNFQTGARATETARQTCSHGNWSCSLTRHQRTTKLLEIYIACFLTFHSSYSIHYLPTSVAAFMGFDAITDHFHHPSQWITTPVKYIITTT